MHSVLKGLVAWSCDVCYARLSSDQTFIRLTIDLGRISKRTARKYYWRSGSHRVHVSMWAFTFLQGKPQGFETTAYLVYSSCYVVIFRSFVTKVNVQILPNIAEGGVKANHLNLLLRLVRSSYERTRTYVPLRIILQTVWPKYGENLVISCYNDSHVHMYI